MPEDPTEEPTAVDHSSPPPPTATTKEGGRFEFTPTLKNADNVFQAKFIGATVPVCIVIAVVWDQLYPPWYPIWIPLVTGILAGLAIGVFVSGSVLAFRRPKK